MKNAFDGLIIRLDLAEERISELEDVSAESQKTKKQRKQRPPPKKNPKQNMQTVGQLQNV